MAEMTAEEVIAAHAQKRTLALPKAKGKDIKHKDHVAIVRKFGRGLAFPLMIAMSGGAFITLAGVAVNQFIAAVQAGNFDAQTITVGMTLVIVLFLVLGMDVLEIVLSYDVMKKAEQGIPAKEYGGELALISFIGMIESITYGVLLSKLEHPDAKDYLAVLLIVLRCVATPIVAVKLATLGDPIVTDREMWHALDVETTNGIAQVLQGIKVNPSVDALPLLMGFKRWLRQVQSGNIDEAAATKMKENDEELIDFVQQILPGAVAARAQEEIREARRRVEAAEAERDQHADHAWREAQNMIRDGLLHLALKGELSDELKDRFPDLADVQLAGAAPKRVARAMPATPANDLRGAALEAGVERFVTTYADPKTKAKKKAHGVWIRSRDVALFAPDGVMSDDEAKTVATLIGGGAKDGTAYCAPLRAVLVELKRISKIDPKFERFIASADSAEETEGE